MEWNRLRDAHDPSTGRPARFGKPVPVSGAPVAPRLLSEGVRGAAPRVAARWQRPGRLGPRNADADLLEHPRRRAIHEAVQQRPGIRIGELRAGLEYPLSSVIHHLRVLSARGLVRMDARPGSVRAFPDGVLPSEPGLGREAGRILRVVEMTPGARLREIATRTGKSMSLATHYLQGLLKRGLVRPEREGRYRRWYPIHAPRILEVGPT